MSEGEHKIVRRTPEGNLELDLTGRTLVPLAGKAIGYLLPRKLGMVFDLISLGSGKDLFSGKEFTPKEKAFRAAGLIATAAVVAGKAPEIAVIVGLGAAEKVYDAIEHKRQQKKESESIKDGAVGVDTYKSTPTSEISES